MNSISESSFGVRMRKFRDLFQDFLPVYKPSRPEENIESLTLLDSSIVPAIKTQG